MKEDNNNSLNDLCDALVLLETQAETYNFLKDLCTPQEISTLAERWRVCRLLNNEDLSYREINRITGASVSTIGRVARFLKTEPHHGYITLLKKLQAKASIK